MILVSFSSSHISSRSGIEADVSPLINKMYFYAIAILIKVEKDVKICFNVMSQIHILDHKIVLKLLATIQKSSLFSKRKAKQTTKM